MFRCVNCGKVCTACGDCQERKLIFHDIYGEPIYEGDTYYGIYGDIVFEDNITDYLRQFKKVAHNND